MIQRKVDRWGNDDDIGVRNAKKLKLKNYQKKRKFDFEVLKNPHRYGIM